MLSVTGRAVHGASMSLAPRLWLGTPNSLACSRLSCLKAALPGADNSRMHCIERGSTDFQVCGIASFRTRRRCDFGPSADLEVGDTAGLESSATSCFA